jgi:DNA-directed RNA polymerase subunit RPC12/RpoP
MLAVGQEELGEQLGKLITCPHCDKKHRVKFGNEVRADGSEVPSKLLSFYKCSRTGKTYLAGINGQSIMHKLGGKT